MPPGRPIRSNRESRDILDAGQSRWREPFTQSPQEYTLTRHGGKVCRGSVNEWRKEKTMPRWLILTLAGLAGGAIAASSEWQSIGENANGNRIYVDKSSVKTSSGITSVTFRTELRTPLDTPKGGINSMRSQMKVNCKEMTAAGIEVILFEDEAKNQAFARNRAAKIEYLKEPEGSSADMVVRFVCRK
jgi:hypothetical protein